MVACKVIKLDSSLPIHIASSCTGSNHIVSLSILTTNSIPLCKMSKQATVSNSFVNHFKSMHVPRKLESWLDPISHHRNTCRHTVLQDTFQFPGECISARPMIHTAYLASYTPHQDTANRNLCCISHENHHDFPSLAPCFVARRHYETWLDSSTRCDTLERAAAVLVVVATRVLASAYYHHCWIHIDTSNLDFLPHNSRLRKCPRTDHCCKWFLRDTRCPGCNLFRKYPTSPCLESCFAGCGHYEM